MLRGKQRTNQIKRIAFSVQALILLVPVLFLALPVFAATLDTRSIEISTAVPGSIANYAFTFTPSSSSSVASIAFEFCDNSALFEDPCNPPSTLDVTTANLASQVGNLGFSVSGANITANKLVLSRPSAAMNTSASGYTFGNITNPNLPGQTIFVRISSFSSNDGTGVDTDHGAVAFSLQNTFAVGAFVPPFIKLCAGLVVSIDCSSGNGSLLDLGDLTSTQAAKGTSQFSVATNDPGGYQVYVTGTTMTSGNNTITALSTPAGSVPGTSQFGINLSPNTVPIMGNIPDGGGSGLSANPYNIPNIFAFNSGDMISSSNSSTDYTRSTVSYIANIPKSQPPGYYATTLVFVASAQF